MLERRRTGVDTSKNMNLFKPPQSANARDSRAHQAWILRALGRSCRWRCFHIFTPAAPTQRVSYITPAVRCVLSICVAVGGMARASACPAPKASHDAVQAELITAHRDSLVGCFAAVSIAVRRFRARRSSLARNMLEEAVFTRACAFLEEAARLRRLPRYCRGAIARFMLPSAVAAFGGDTPAVHSLAKWPICPQWKQAAPPCTDGHALDTWPS